MFKFRTSPIILLGLGLGLSAPLQAGYPSRYNRQNRVSRLAYEIEQTTKQIHRKTVTDPYYQTRHSARICRRLEELEGTARHFRSRLERLPLTDRRMKKSYRKLLKA